MVRFQKLTRNLFLILHGHNVHRQQRQLSKFLMRFQQFASHAYCGASFQDGVAAGKGFLLAPFWGVQICDYSAAWVSCTVITDLDTSKRSTQKAFSCCDAILKTGPAESIRSELLVAHEKLGQLLCWRCTLCPCKVRNKFLVNFWNRTILLCIPCISTTWPDTRLFPSKIAHFSLSEEQIDIKR